MLNFHSIYTKGNSKVLDRSIANNSLSSLYIICLRNYIGLKLVILLYYI